MREITREEIEALMTAEHREVMAAFESKLEPLEEECKAMLASLDSMEKEVHQYEQEVRELGFLLRKPQFFAKQWLNIELAHARVETKAQTNS